MLSTSMPLAEALWYPSVEVHALFCASRTASIVWSLVQGLSYGNS